MVALMETAPQSVRELAAELGAHPKTMRAWMRRQGWRSAVEMGQPWLITPAQAADLRRRFSGEDIEQPALTDDPLPDLTVGELLDTYRSILTSLRSRGLVRTNNAPIGDLAEYCAAVVYDGLLAPNSEKSYDLVAEDGRRVQVKVRLIRPATSKAAVFSPIRSFDFDGCVFLLVDDEAGEVISARELTVDEVRLHGRHRIHTNGVVVRLGQVRGVETIGVDLTEPFRVAWRELMGRRT
jgi:hypothetical protein